MSNDAIRRYVRLLVNQGCNVQPGQQILVQAEPASLPVLEWIAEACYERGARFVDYQVTVPRVERAHVRGARAEGLTFVPGYRTVQMDQLVDSQGAMLSLWSYDEPDLYTDADAKGLNQVRLARREATRRLVDEGIQQWRMAWCGAGIPSPGWAEKVFPELSPAQALRALWKAVLKMTFADRADCEKRWARHLTQLARRARTLTERGIRQLHFRNPRTGTDLHVRLSPRARWVGGGASTLRGVHICPNIPTYEVFTTPDWRGTEGVVATTRPVLINGLLVEGLRLRFEGGVIVEAHADSNLAAYEALIDTHPTARRLGEVALVGIDSPIFQSGRIFRSTLYDENAACHIATGMAYREGLEKGDLDLDELGFNGGAKNHQDIMISDEHTTVSADGQEIIVDGQWCSL